MERSFDVVVLGTGSAGSTAAQRCRAAGRSVAIVDRRPFGGTCALRGCDPKKVLVGVAQLVDWSSRMRERGVVNETLRIDWPALMRFKRTFTDPVTPAREEAFARSGIVAFHGAARFAGERRIAVGDNVLVATHVVIATGAKPATLHIDGEQHLADSTAFLALETPPKRVLFLGGGFISFEFAHVASRAGARAQIIERESRPLGPFDAELVDRLVDATRAQEIDVHLNTTVSSIERTANGFVVRGTQEERPCSFEADLVVHGGGRVADIGDLDLESGGVARAKAGIAVNEYLQSTSNPAVYAAGDCAAGGGAPLTPVAALEGEIAADNLLGGNRRRPDFRGLASMVYAIPPLGMVGMTEEAARKNGLAIAVRTGDSATWYSSRRIGAKASAYKLVLDEATGELVGAHVLGFEAEELTNLFALAMRARVTRAALDEVLFAYPTGASDIEYMT
jgi:glutathione reductase (NADPH)